MKKTKERNQIFNYLYVLGILMVIDDHVSSRIGLLTNVFPYNSFYMPLFVFISGYFYKKTNILDNIKHKTKKLLVPYLIWNVIAILLSILLWYIFGINWFKVTTVKQALVMMITNDSITSLNGAAWFVIMLFWVSIIYNAIHCKIKDNKVIDIISTIIYTLIGFLSLFLCIKGFYSYGELWIFILKIMFYIQFYNLGVMFRKYFEKILLKCNKFIVCAICVIINLLLIKIFGSIEFIGTATMSFFISWYLPLITSITGILFYYEIMEFLSRKIGKTKITDFISRNTFIILETHLLFVNIPNLYIYLKILNGSKLYPDFDLLEFINSAWVRYSPTTRLIGFFTGLFGSLLVAFIIEKVKNRKLLKK